MFKVGYLCPSVAYSLLCYQRDCTLKSSICLEEY